MEKPAHPPLIAVDASGERDIVVTRWFDAPRELVFEALTRPELLKRWFDGPEGWRLVACEFEPRVGGIYRNVWRQLSDGYEMGMGGVIREFLPPERIVATEKYDEAWYPGEAVSMQVLTEARGGTLLTLTVTYDSRETRDLVLRSPMQEGLKAGYDKLDAFLRRLVEERGASANR